MKLSLGRHEIHVCTRCRVDGGEPGPLLTERLLARIDADAGFLVNGIGCMAGCSRPLTVGFAAPGKASYLFGDIDPIDHVEPLLEFGRLYRSLANGWTNEGQRPPGLAGKIIARIPAPASGVSP